MRGPALGGSQSPESHCSPELSCRQRPPRACHSARGKMKWVSDVVIPSYVIKVRPVMAIPQSVPKSPFLYLPMCLHPRDHGSPQTFLCPCDGQGVLSSSGPPPCPVCHPQGGAKLGTSVKRERAQPQLAPPGLVSHRRLSGSSSAGPAHARTLPLFCRERSPFTMI